MNGDYQLRKLSIAEDVKEGLARECDALVSRPDTTTTVCPFVPESACAIVKVILQALNDVGLSSHTVRAWHLMQFRRTTRRDVAFRDVVIQGGAKHVCVILPIRGEGSITLSSCESAVKRVKHVIQLPDSMCVVFTSNLMYSLVQTDMYLHITCNADDTESIVKVCTPVKYACPYKTSLDFGDVRMYPRRFVPSVTSVGCDYSASRWKNVLDHLVFCKHNPETDKCIVKQEKRRKLKQISVQCEICQHAFTNRNSLVQHKRRHHNPIDPPLWSPLLWSSKHASRSVVVKQQLAQTEDKQQQASTNTTGSVLDISTGSVLDLFNSIIDKSKRLRAPPASSPRDASMSSSVAFSSPPIGSSSSSVASSSPPIGSSSSSVASSSPPVASEIAQTIVHSMLAFVSKSDVAQPSGQAECNTGELTMVGVTMLLHAIGPLLPCDTFVDVGSGVGNVIFQVALESTVAKVVGIEVRRDLAELSQSLIVQHCATEGRLHKITILNVDIAQADAEKLPGFQDATHVFSHNSLFTSSSLLALEELCWLPKLKKIAVVIVPCPRHTARCTKAFCRYWALDSVVHLPVAYKTASIAVHIYKRKTS